MVRFIGRRIASCYLEFCHSKEETRYFGNVLKGNVDDILQVLAIERKHTVEGLPSAPVSQHALRLAEKINPSERHGLERIDLGSAVRKHLTEKR